MLKNINILLVEPDRACASAIAFTLSQAHATLSIASSGDQALGLSADQRPHLALISLSPDQDLDGIEIARGILSRLDVTLIYLGPCPEEQTLIRALTTAPSGYLLKPIDPRQLLLTVRLALTRRRAEADAASQRERCFREGMRRIATDLAEMERAAREGPPDALAGSPPGPPARSEPAGLSPREWQVLRALQANGRVATIARALFISENTVRNHLKAIFRKLNVSSQTELLERMQSLSTQLLH